MARAAAWKYRGYVISWNRRAHKITFRRGKSSSSFIVDSADPELILASAQQNIDGWIAAQEANAGAEVPGIDYVRESNPSRKKGRLYLDPETGATLYDPNALPRRVPRPREYDPRLAGRQFMHRGYAIGLNTVSGRWTISRNGGHVGGADSAEAAKGIVDILSAGDTPGHDPYNRSPNPSARSLFVVRGIPSGGGQAWYYTGRAGSGWVSQSLADAFKYTDWQATLRKAQLFNSRTALTGLTFEAQVLPQSARSPNPIQSSAQSVLAELSRLWHLSKVHSSSSHSRRVWTSGELSKLYPEISPTAAYKALDRMLARYPASNDSATLSFIDSILDRSPNPGPRSVHTKKWDDCVKEVRAKGGGYSPYAVCTAELGERGSIKAGHRRSNPLGPEDPLHAPYGPQPSFWDVDHTTLKSSPWSEWQMSQRVKQFGGVKISRDRQTIEFPDGETYMWDKRFNWWAPTRSARGSNPVRRHGPKRGVIPKQLRPYLFKRGHNTLTRHRRHARTRPRR